MLFEIFQRARGEPVPPQAARQREQVNVGIAFEGDGDSMQRVAGDQQRRVEGFAVERHQSLARREEVDQRFEHGGLLRRVAQEELLESEFPVHEARRANEEGIRPRAAGNAGGFSIQKGEFMDGQFRNARVVCPL